MGRDWGGMGVEALAAFSDRLFISSRWRSPVDFVILIFATACSVPAAARLPIPLLSDPSQQHVQHYGLGSWRLHIVTSAFSGDIRCRLEASNGKMVYARHALAIRFRKHAPVENAWVKIDHGPAQRWRDMLPELARLGVAIDGRDMDSPTDGVLWLPITAIEKASQVEVQLRPNQPPRLFSLAHFVELRAAARRLGCDPEARFIP